MQTECSFPDGMNVVRKFQACHSDLRRLTAGRARGGGNSCYSPHKHSDSVHNHHQDGDELWAVMMIVCQAGPSWPKLPKSRQMAGYLRGV